MALAEQRATPRKRPGPLEIADPQASVPGQGTASSSEAGNYSPLPSASSSKMTTPLHSSWQMNPEGGNISDMERHQLYRKFRLQMVEMFGSVASAVYELSEDPDNGNLTRAAFIELLSQTLKIFKPVEAEALFEHLSGMDCTGQERLLHYGDFEIKKNDWECVVAQKKRANEGNAVPFESAPGGGSVGVYHRPMGVDAFATRKGDYSRQVSHESRRSPPREDSTQGSPRPPPSRESQGSQGRKEGSQGRPPGAATGQEQGSGQEMEEKPPPRTQPSSKPKRSTMPRASDWRRPQRPWAPSMFAGEGAGSVKAEDLFSMGRPRTMQTTFGLAARYTLTSTQLPKFEQLGQQRRARLLPEEGHFLVGSCPSRRPEMEPDLVSKQPLWWPYDKHEAPPRRIEVPRTLAVEPAALRTTR